MKKIIIFLLLLFSAASSHAASVPSYINYQGMLTDAAGQPETTGIKKLTFNIYDAATGGNLVWGPQVFTTVPVINGTFNIILGEKDTALRPIVDAFNTDARFLGIIVDEVDQSVGTEIVPRQQILSAPYAIQAEKAETAAFSTHHSNIIPVGMLAPFWGTVAPEGWFICNGSAIEDDPKFDALKAIVGSNVPDMQDLFLRGKSASREIGSYQEDDFKTHKHLAQGVPSNLVGGPYVVLGNAAAGIQTSANSTEESGGTETRPKNIAVNYIIKY